MTRELDLAAACAAMASLPPGTDERPCNHCRVMTREECLVEADVRLWPLEELCEECDEMLRSDLADEVGGECR